MGKIEIEVELQGFKLRVKGDREDAPRISGEIGKQIAGMLQPPAGLLDQPVRKQVDSAVVSANNINGNGSGGRGGKGTRGNKTPSKKTPVVPLAWTHDPAKWGNPRQTEWKAGNKVVWLLYVIQKETSHTEASAAVISETFNTKFKQFGILKRSSMPSILNSLKTNEPALVGDDPAKTPITWFLTDAGLKVAESLVQDARKAAGPPKGE